MDKKLINVINSIKIYLRNYTSDSELINDITQETLYKGLEYGKVLHENIGWLCIVAKRKLFKKSKLDVVSVKELFDDEEEKTEQDSITEYMYLLTNKNRQLIYMKYFSKFSIKELSDVLKLPQGTIKRQLFNAREQLRKEIAMSETMSVPEILITKNTDPKVNEIKIVGQDLFMGNPALPIGIKDKVQMYMYPGRLFSYEAITESKREMTLMGKNVIEVINTYTKREGEIQRRMYYEVSEDKLSMIMRIFEREDGIEVETDEKDLVKPCNRNLKLGNFRNEKYISETTSVNVKIGEKFYPDSFQVITAENDYHGKELNIEYFSSDGRPILQRTFIGDDWKMGGYVTWDKVKDSYEKEFNEEKYRLWIEIVLVDSYTTK